jgi:FMN-dependent NADH-azoreductase
VALSRGGLHRDAPTDTQLAHIKMFLSFVGLTDVQYVFAEGWAWVRKPWPKRKPQAEAEINAILV